MGDVLLVEEAINDEKNLSFNYTTQKGVEAFYIIQPIIIFKSKQGKLSVKAIVKFKDTGEEEEEEPEEDLTEEEEEEIDKTLITPKFRIDRMENIEIVARL